ncbi:MAG: hypothetical protein M5R37_12750 [Melioribacteraceae bacterium]|nr:hypothetical protein [Melioribacteraceae bacterium]
MISKNIVKILFLVAITSFILFSLRVILGGEYFRAQYIGDDSYYYLNLARNFVNNGTWSFDKFWTVTTGFHLFNAYFISGIYYIFRDDYFIILPGIYFFLALLIIFQVYSKIKFNKVAVLLFAVVISTFSTVINVISFMEWIWTVLFVLLGYNIFSDKLYSKKYFIIIAFFGTLTRIEYIFFPLTVLFTFLFYRWDRGSILKTNIAYFLLGAISGVVFITVHNYVISGSLLQSSANIKLFQSLIVGVNPLPFIYQAIRAYIGIPRLNIFSDSDVRMFFYNIIVVLSILFSILLFLRKKLIYTKLKEYIIVEIVESPVIFSSVLLIVVITVFYSFNSFSMQIWYSAIWIVPSFICLSNYIEKINKKVIIAILTVLIVFNISTLWITEPFNSGQESGITLANVVNKKLTDKKLAAWDAGILGFYTKGRVINLDGLVNNEVIDYIKDGKLEKYILYKDIDYLLQFPPLKNEYYGFEYKEINKIFRELRLQDNSGNVFKVLEIIQK